MSRRARYNAATAGSVAAPGDELPLVPRLREAGRGEGQGGGQIVDGVFDAGGGDAFRRPSHQVDALEGSRLRGGAASGDLR